MAKERRIVSKLRRRIHPLSKEQAGILHFKEPVPGSVGGLLGLTPLGHNLSVIDDHVLKQLLGLTDGPVGGELPEEEVAFSAALTSAHEAATKAINSLDRINATLTENVRELGATLRVAQWSNQSNPERGIAI